jgi:hypothetical protein
MSTLVFAVVLLTCAAFYFMSAEERARAVRLAVAAAKDAIRKAREGSSADDPFDEMLRARTGRLVVTPLLVAVNAIVFTRMLFGSGAFDDMQTLVGWGGNFAIRTANGEWWRLLGSTFVHGGLFHFLTAMAALVSLGLLLERAVGRIVFATIYLASGARQRGQSGHVAEASLRIVRQLRAWACCWRRWLGPHQRPAGDWAGGGSPRGRRRSAFRQSRHDERDGGFRGRIRGRTCRRPRRGP